MVVYNVDHKPAMHKVSVTTTDPVVLFSKIANSRFPLPPIRALKLVPGTDGTLTVEARYHPEDDWFCIDGTGRDSIPYGDYMTNVIHDLDGWGELRISATGATGTVFLIT